MNTKVERLLAGERVVASTDELAEIVQVIGNDVASCLNRKAVGTKDTYVVWAARSAKPLDLEFRTGGFAIGSP